MNNLAPKGAFLWPRNYSNPHIHFTAQCVNRAMRFFFRVLIVVYRGFKWGVVRDLINSQCEGLRDCWHLPDSALRLIERAVHADAWDFHSLSKVQNCCLPNLSIGISWEKLNGSTICLGLKQVFSWLNHRPLVGCRFDGGAICYRTLFLCTPQFWWRWSALHCLSTWFKSLGKPHQ